MSHLNNSVVFFYSQPEVLRNPGKRAKKILSDNQIKNLSKKIGDKYTSDLLNSDDSNMSLAARLAEFANQSVVSMNSSTNMSRINHRGTIYTDTRLQAIKFLTEEMLKELEEKLKFYSQNELVVNLPGQVIYDFHSDWSDLTDGCLYNNFPRWQTKNGRESITKKGDKNEKKDKNEDSAAQLTSESGSDARKESRKSSNSKIMRQNSKLTAISEKGSDSRNSQNPLAVRRSSSTAKNQSPAFKSRAEIGSRLAHNPSVSTGYTVKFELSNKVNRDKGWTVLKIDREEELIDNSRRILACLKNSLANIEEVRMLNIRSGLIKPSKIRFYGDHKKEQVEKYKATIIRPKKSLFAMSILRNELPKSLDVEYMLELISNPNLIGLTSNSSALNGSRSSVNLNQSKQISSSIQLPRPPDMLNTQTNDGTTSIYYKNGQLAILIANVYGYFIESSSSESRGPVNSMQASINGSFTTSNNMPNMTLCSQNVKNSYTTVIYDINRKPKSGSSSALTSSDRLGTNNSSDENDESIRKIFEKSKREQKLLAVISALGYCVVYRNNGKPRFICTENGGCLCNSNGSVSYQWKWDDIRFSDYERIKDELSIELNEFIWLSYKNPGNIKLRYACDKEVMDFDLSSPKENYNRLHDLLNRSVCDFPMKSRLSSLKVSPNAKLQQIVNYKQHHHQQQITNHSNQKVSVFMGNQMNKESEKVKIDKLLEKTVSFKDVPLMKDLLVTQKKIRSLLEDWLVYSRTCLSILEPNLYILPDFPVSNRVNRLNQNHSDFNKIIFHRRKSRSVENFSSASRFNFDYELLGRNKAGKKSSMLHKSVDFNPLIDEDKRSKSALITRNHGVSVKDQAKIIAKLKAYRSSDDCLKSSTIKATESINQLNFSKSAIWSVEDLNRAKTLSSNRVLSNFNQFKASFTFDLDNTYASKSSRLYTNDDLNLLCPLSLHQKLSFDRYDVDCRCKKQIVPIISDVEFDFFLRLVPIEQIIVIAVIDSEYPTSYLQIMLTSLHESNNKNRVQPCRESLRDEIRYLFYDLKLASDDSDHSQPMLVTRHNVASGTVLIYKNSKLLFCDRIFNGYGYSLQDFLKQISKSKEDAKNEKYLPYNFRFNQSNGKQGKRTAWGGQIDGSEEENYVNRIPQRVKSALIVKDVSKNKLQRREKTSINLPKINKSTVQV